MNSSSSNEALITRVLGNDIVGSVRDALDHFVALDFTDKDYIIIKPNLCDCKSHETGCTTNPAVVEGVVSFLRLHTKAKIAIVESDGLFISANEAFTRLGYTDLAERHGVDLINLTKDETHTVLLNGHYFRTMKVPVTLLRATKLISVAQLKTHYQHRMTCVLKNQFNLIPTPTRARYHPFMEEVLWDINQAYGPTLCIIAGTGMEGDGPSDGIPRDEAVLVAGYDAILVDALAAQIMGLSPHSVPYLSYALKHASIPEQVVQSALKQAKLPAEPFSFIPTFSYYLNRLALKCQRANRRTVGLLRWLSDISELLAMVVTLTVRGYLPTLTAGIVQRSFLRRAFGAVVKKANTVLWLRFHGF